jgi:alpha-galactosidase/6-phospho-beta-glucosidase family protein
MIGGGYQVAADLRSSERIAEAVVETACLTDSSGNRNTVEGGCDEEVEAAIRSIIAGFSAVA